MNQVARQINTENIPLSVEALKGVMPKRQKHNITQSLVDELNAIVTEPEARDSFRENLLGYSNVLQDPNIRLPTYIEAVKYVSFKLLGYSNQDSWIKTFPERYKRLLADKKDDQFIRSTVACYNRNKVVNMILEQTMVPTWVVNQDLYQRALNVQAKLMVSATSELVRTQAANSLLVQLRQPETTKLSLDINIKEDDSIRELRETTLELVKAQRLAIESGAMNAKQVAEGKIITGECERLESK